MERMRRKKQGRWGGDDRRWELGKELEATDENGVGAGRRWGQSQALSM
jgi:hypothetical protein